MYQMTIFDIQQNELEQYSEEQMAQIIGEALGLHFKYNPMLEVYETKVQGHTIDVHYSRYDTLDDNQGKLFIGIGIQKNSGDFEGWGCPMDSFEEAITGLRNGMKRRGLKVL